MNLVDAFSFLGLDTDAEPDQIRRAYLRLVKKYHPERDPDGFQRLRAAYETARNSTTDETAQLGHGRPAAWSVEEASAGGPDRHMDEQARQQFALRPFLVKLEGVSDDLDDAWAAREEIAREAVDALPDNPDAVMLLATVLRNSGKSDESLAVLRAGSARGLEACKASIFLWHGDELTDDERAWPASRPVAEVLQMAIQLLEAGQGGRATPLVEMALQRADEVASAIFAWGQTQVCLLLQMDGQVNLARRLLPEIDRRMDVTAWGDEGAEIAVVWKLTRELTEIPDGFPSHLRKALAAGIYEERLTDVNDVMHEYAMAHPSLAHKASRHLMHAPTLDHLYRHLLSGRESIDYSGPLSVAVPVFGILWLMIVVARCADSNSPPRYIPPPATHDSIVQVADPIQSLCKSDSARVVNACGALRAGIARVNSYRCLDALEPLATLEGADDLAPGDRDKLVEALRTHWVDLCGARAVAADWPSYGASPNLFAKCSVIDATLDSGQLEFCYRSRSTLSALGVSECGEARESFAELNQRVHGIQDEMLRAGLEEVWSQVVNVCGEATE